MTNNVAEYYGLIAALDYAQSNHINALRIESDSELLVKQMRGQYKVKSGDLKPLFERAKKMSQSFALFRIEHVYREQNAEADALANEAMDEVSGKPSSASPRLPLRRNAPRKRTAKTQSPLLPRPVATRRAARPSRRHRSGNHTSAKNQILTPHFSA